MEPRERFVPWDRWDEAHQRLQDMVRYTEQRLRDLLEAVDARLSDRIGDVEAQCKALETVRDRRRDRVWLIAMAFLTGLVIPLVLLAVTSHIGG